MKKLLIIITTLMVMSSCSTTKEAKSSRIETRKEKKLAEMVVVKDAVESRRFIVNLDHLYLSHGGMIDLIPRRNYIIVDGEKAIIRAGYIGRQYDVRPIAGIRMNGEATKYELSTNISKGNYKINMKVNNGNVSFDVSLTIDKSGSCSASVSNLRLDYVRYTGHVVPIKDKNTDEPKESNII
jgi:hypothetical protein